MLLPIRAFAAPVVVLALAAVWGCAPASAPKTPPAKTAAASGDDEETVDPLANLTPADRAEVEAQKMCPVSDHPLVSMSPVKVTIDGKSIWICCKGCESDLRKDPDKYFAKLEKPAN